MQIGEVNLSWLGHSGIYIQGSKIIYIDPYQINPQQKADIILLTHPHQDHCSIQDIEKIIKPGTIIICPPDCQSKLSRFQNIEVKIAEPGSKINLNSIKILGFPAYNINKNFHEKSEYWLGYIISLNNIILYHAGDTDLIPEMEKLTGYSKQGNQFISLLPVGGTYTMSPEQAAKAAFTIKPKLTIPIHYGSEVIGIESDADKFIELCQEQNIKAEKLEKI